MENVNNPNDIVRPRSSAEKAMTFFQKGRITSDLIERLSKLGTEITFPDGTKKEITMKDVKKEIDYDVKYNNKYNPDGFSYNAYREASRKRAKMMNTAINNSDYKALIKPMLDEAIRNWGIAEKMDKQASEMSPKERAIAEKNYKKNLENEIRISKLEEKTGKRHEHGFPPQMLEVDGKSYRVRSQAFLAYAVTLAKKVLSESR